MAHKENSIFPTYKQAEIILTTYLSEHKLRQTQERLAILRYICSLQRHFKAEDIIKEVCEQEHISTGTIYNSLSLFCDAHILRILPQRQQQSPEYELAISEKNTMRIVCTKCGRETNFKLKTVETLLTDRQYKNFNMDNFCLTIYGQCKVCRKNVQKV